MMEDFEKQTLNSDEDIIARYLMKLFDLHFDDLNKKDLLSLMTFYVEDLRYKILHNCASDSESESPHIAIGLKVSEYLTNRSQSCDSLSMSWNSAPIVCFRCKKKGHIARGCKEFKCFRCKEIGHVISGCRKRKSKSNTRSPSHGSGSKVSSSVVDDITVTKDESSAAETLSVHDVSVCKTESTDCQRSNSVHGMCSATKSVPIYSG